MLNMKSGILVQWIFILACVSLCSATVDVLLCDAVTFIHFYVWLESPNTFGAIAHVLFWTVSFVCVLLFWAGDDDTHLSMGMRKRVADGPEERDLD